MNSQLARRGDARAWAHGPGCAYPQATLDQLIIEQARRTPGAAAVCQRDVAMTYAGLVRSAAGIASRLRSDGIGPEDRVGICLRRTPTLPVAVLGVLLAGGAYVPLDQSHPAQRLAGIIDDAGARLVIADEPGLALLAGSGARLIEPPLLQPSGGVVPADLAGSGAVPGNAAYVMYTSGSTGRPKGVVVSHRNVAAFAAAVQARSPIGPGCRSAGFASLGFDTSLFDLFVPLTLGATVALVPDADRIDPLRLARFLAGHRVTRAMLPPAVLPLLDPAGLPDLTDIFSAGEPCGPEQVARWSAGHRRFHNWYGPTETTVIVVGAELAGAWDRPLPIGTPLPGCRAWVLDEALTPCPPGVAGELHIGGPQLARGYLGQPGQTAGRFIPDPFGEPGSRLYRTGDLVRWDADGTIEYLGRLDRQVKIGGQRAEIGEIEAVLQAHPAVSQAVVDVTRGPAGITQLIAYVAPQEAPGLREICAARLPEHMIPVRLYRLATLPLNVSGKVDLAALRAIAAREEHAVPAGPVPADAVRADAVQADAGQAGPGPLAIALLVGQAWGEVFQTASPGPDEEFIALGGHSLLAMRLVAAVRSRTGRQLEVEDVYRGRTVAGLARIAAQSPAAEDDAAIPAGSQPALTAAQRRMWFVEQLSPDCPMHNVAMAQRLRGSLDVAALGAALRRVAGRHQVLRWRLISRAGQPHVLADAADPELAITDLSDLMPPERDDALGQALEHEASAPLALDEGPLWRARLIRLAPDLHVLAITVHHLVFDGWSRDVLYRDLGLAYRTARDGRPAEPEPLAVQYPDYAAWSAAQARRRSGPDLAWWLEHLAGAPLVVDLPRDAARPPVRTYTGAKAQLTLDPAPAAAVRAVALAAGTTCFTVLLAVFAQLISRLTGQRDLIIGTPAADRGPAAFEPLIGLCLHMLPLRLIISDDDSFDDHLRRTAAELSAVLAHPHAPAERITESLGQQRDLSRNPLFQVLFNAYDFTSARLELAGIAASPEPEGMAGALFDLTLYVSERAERFELRAVYNADLYTAARIEALLAAYSQLAGELTARPGRPVAAASARPAGTGLPDASAPLPSQAGPGALERVLAAAARTPCAVAVTGAGGELRYRDLLALANRISAALAGAGVRAGDAVAVLAARDVSLPAILLGVLASGARWLILDPSPGDPRIARQLAAARVTALIRVPGTELPRPLPAGVAVIEAGAPDAGADREEVAALPPAMRGYLSLTSGTTGEAKIVTTSDRPLGHFLGWYLAAFGLGPADRFAMLSGLGHDPLLRDVFTPLAVGGRLCVPEQRWLRDPARLAGWLRAEQVTVVHVTPQVARLLAAVSSPGALPQLRLVALGGDLATTADAIRLRAIAPDARIINCYGTTETPQIQAWHEIGLAGHGLAGPEGPGQPLPVGRGIEGAQLLVVGAGGRPAGVGELGDVVIRSRHLAAGYACGDDDAGPGGSRFRPGPAADPDDRSFVTGDLGRYLPDGTVALAGRADRQIKIRGFRVEPGEVEAVLRARPEVSQACVAVTPDGDERQLWAYVVPADSGVDAAALGDQLRASLPEYAVPAGVSLIAALPLTANGKVDLARLPRPVPAGRRVSGGEPATATERAIARAWSEVLGAPGFGVTDNFFDLGGHSLAVVAVQARLAELLGKTIPVVDLFRFPVIRALAAYIDDTDAPKISAEVARAAQRAAQRRDLARRRSARPPRRS